ncbi:bifunctional histidine phosphatase family protein/GNAT family N-acetyltransferase [Flavonifractor hominis]|uniref:Bifunctional histidine phosphatase family protein/GNAT family N-acetyltransferase n=1 Tax=Flavonifractor hominis TaxID=3133178 RepID=A0ABV1EKF6_9FIRM
MTRVYLIRHAEAEGNLYRRVHGWYNSLITDNGYRQIAALRGRFADVPIDAVYSSDLFRTKTTAGAIYLTHGLELRTLPELREIGVGEWEDRTWGELERTDAVRLIRFNHSAPDFQVRGGETFDQVQQRMKRAVLSLAAAHPGQTIALFSHGTAIRCLQGAVRGLGPGEMDELGHSDNTAVTCLEVEGEYIRIVFENDNSHLPEEISTLARQKWWKQEGGRSADANLWFRPLDLESQAELYSAARHDAWVDICGPDVPFDRDGFLKDAMRCWKQDPGKAICCAMRGDEIAGVLQLDLERDRDEGAGYIPFLYILPQFRRQGLGVQLIGQAVSTFRPLGRTTLRLCCAPDNGRAQRFYQRYGFRKNGQMPGSRQPLDRLEKYIGYEPKEP